MKIRQGFVSNSSSSSFVITLKKNQELTKAVILKELQVEKTSPLYGFAENLAEFIISNSEKGSISTIYENYITSSRDKTDDEMIDELSEEAGFDRTELEDVRDGKSVQYFGSACSDSGDALEYYLYEQGLNIDTEGIKMDFDR